MSRARLQSLLLERIALIPKAKSDCRHYGRLVREALLLSTAVYIPLRALCQPRDPPMLPSTKTKEQWFESFRNEGIEKVTLDFSRNRWKKDDPQVHGHAREWVDVQRARRIWSRADVIALMALVVSLVEVVATITVPELRELVGLSRN